VTLVKPAERIVEAVPATATRRPVQRAKRQATENAIIDAFERLLNRNGVAGIGVNALVKEAGVGKKQIYDYFGGLSGVAEAWVKGRSVWKPLEDFIDEPMAQFLAREPAEKLRIVNRRYADSLRSNPGLCELLTGEFMKDTDVKEAVDHIRQLIRLDFERVLTSDPRLSHPDMLSLNTVAYAAATYLGMRAHHQPKFFGFDLSAETSWQMVLSMFERVLVLADPDRCDKIDRVVSNGEGRS
jgi:AcrR family transcriptional regulator